MIEVAEIVQVSTAAAVWFGVIVARRHLRESQKLRKAEYRPYVTVHPHRSPKGLLTVKLVNLGRVAAQDVLVTFTPELTASPPAGPCRQFDQITFLAPEDTREIALGVEHKVLNDDRPLRYDVTVSYRADDAVAGKHPDEYRHNHTLDLTELKGLLMAGRSS